MEKAKAFETIVTNLNILRYIIYSKVKVGQYDINKRSEDFFCGLLNIVYGWELQNLNKKTLSFPGIDLGSKKDRVSVQVTSQSSYKKIDGTLEKFDKYEYSADYDRVVVFNITTKSKHSKDFVCKSVAFDCENDIMDVDDLLFYIETELQTAAIKRIEEYILREIPYYTNALTNSKDLLHNLQDYKSTEARNYKRLEKHLADHGDLDYLDNVISESKEMLRKLQIVSQRQRNGIVVILTKGKDCEINDNTWGDTLISSFGFSRNDLAPLINSLENAGLAYHNEDEHSPAIVLYEKDFWFEMLAILDRQQLHDLVFNLNFSLLDN